MPKSHSFSEPTAIVLTATIAASVASLVTFGISYKWYQLQIREESQELERRRQEERTGRIRAEKKLRNALNEQRHSSQKNVDDPYAMNLSTIGTVVSPYTKRMGTPRQGALVPHSRGYIQFTNSLSPEAVDGIGEYSHIWVIFQFHANTSLATSKKTKIRPPRGGGRKVGMLATRSPHRPNALGLSLVTMDRWDPKTRRLHINALDLCDGTPVYDIKPYVHWDIPGDTYDKDLLRLPDWVENKNDVLPKVEFTVSALSSLSQHIEDDRLGPLYSSKDKTSFEGAKKTLLEILAQDPRTSHKGVSKNQRGSLSGFESYRIVFCRVEIEFTVEESGATVVEVHPYDADETKDAKEL